MIHILLPQSMEACNTELIFHRYQIEILFQKYLNLFYELFTKQLTSFKKVQMHCHY